MLRLKSNAGAMELCLGDIRKWSWTCSCPYSEQEVGAFPAGGGTVLQLRSSNFRQEGTPGLGFPAVLLKRQASSGMKAGFAECSTLAP